MRSRTLERRYERMAIGCRFNKFLFKKTTFLSTKILSEAIGHEFVNSTS